MKKSTNLNFAIVGCGRIAQRHAEHINTYGKLVAVCDIVKDKADNLAAKFGAVSYETLEALLENEKSLDVVAICTPNGLHAEHTIQALKKGSHVLCEKPMAISTVDCNKMIAAAQNTNKLLFAVKQNRFNPPVAAVKKAIDEGVFGKILSMQLNCFWNRDAEYYRNSWKGSLDLDGGTLFTQFSHFIDLVYWMFGDVERVFAITSNLNHTGIIDFEDTGVVSIEFKNGVLGTLNYTVNSFNKNMEGSLTIFGENGTVKVGGEYLNVLEYENIKDFEFKDLPQGNKANDYGHYLGSMSNHDKVYQNVVDVISNGSQMSASASDATKTVEIIEMIYASAKNNKGN